MLSLTMYFLQCEINGYLLTCSICVEHIRTKTLHALKSVFYNTFAVHRLQLTLQILTFLPDRKWGFWLGLCCGLWLDFALSVHVVLLARLLTVASDFQLRLKFHQSRENAREINKRIVRASRHAGLGSATLEFVGCVNLELRVCIFIEIDSVPFFLSHKMSNLFL